MEDAIAGGGGGSNGRLLSRQTSDTDLRSKGALTSSDMSPSSSSARFNGHYDTSRLKAYFRSLLPILLDSEPELVSELLLDTPAWNETAAAFVGDPSIMTAYVNKIRRQDVSSDAPEHELFDYQMSTQASYSSLHVSSIALIKRVSILEPTVPLPHQLHVLTLFGPAAAAAAAAAAATSTATEAQPVTTSSANADDGEGSTAASAVRESPYEALHSVVHNVMSPWFDAFVASKAPKDKALVSGAKTKESDTKMGIPMAKRKFAELELSLFHLQQNVDIPDIILSIHPVVRAAVERCHAAGTRVSVEAVEPAWLLQDSSFLNKLQSDVNSWVKEVQTITKLDRSVASGTASQEINFWLSMEKAQESIEQQLRSDPIVLTLDILKHAKRFHATVSFLADTGLKDCAEKTHNYNLLMKDFPINELLSATDLDKCADALSAIFNHLNKKLRISPYPVKRALPLVEAISRDLNDTLLKVLASQRIMWQEFPRFWETVSAAAEVFQVWDELMKDFVNIAREVTRKRSEKFLPIKINPAHAKLRERLNYIGAFRKTHEQLRAMVSSGKGLTMPGAVSAGTVASANDRQVATQNLAGIEMSEEIRAAYDQVKVIDVLDVSQEGTEIWTTAEGAYNERVARVENSLIARLRDLLGQAKSAREMLRVLSQFNSLFVRPKVRGAVQEYQQQLLNSVKSDIKALHDKFKAQYRPSEANHMSQLRDVPEIAGAIIWARQIERQLNVYMKRVEDVLGKGWELYAEGQKLQSESETFRRKLDTRPLFDSWLHDINRRDMSITGRVFDVTKNRAAGNAFQLSVNFDGHTISLFKEVRNLIWLNFQIPHAITNLAKDAKKVYPHAVSLMETVRTYNQTCGLVRANPEITCLIAQVYTDAHQLVSQGMTLRWEHFANIYESARAASYLPGSGGETGRENRQVAFVRQFASVVSLFQDKTADLIEIQRDMHSTIEELGKCEYRSEAFAERLQKIQKTIDKLNLEGYPNLDEWVGNLDRLIEDVLLRRLKSVSVAWCQAFVRHGMSQGGTKSGSVRGNKALANGANGAGAGGIDGEAGAASDKIVLQPITHEVRIQNQVIFLDPPLENARASWFRQLHEALSVVCCLTRIQSSRYEIGLQMRGKQRATEQDYTSLLTRFQDDSLTRPFVLIEAKLAEVGSYVSKWLQFQSLWDLETEHVFARLGDSLASWQQLLAEIRRTRATFDNSDSQRSFGICVIDYDQVQSKVNAKYDAWQRDILNRFGTKLGAAMQEVHAAVAKARVELEQHSIEGSSTAQAVTFITFVQDLKRKTKAWQPQIELFGTGQKTLERQRYMFPQDWLYVDQVEGEWSAFQEILGRKNASIQDQLAGLQMKIIAEDKIVSDKMTTIISEWEQQKPIQGTLKADGAMNTINVFETRVSKLAEDRALVVRAKEALDLEHTQDDRLEPVFEELRDLKTVWTALSGTWSQLAEIRDTIWSNVQPRKLRQQLDGLLAQTRDMPSRMRQYAAFEYVQEHVRALLKSNPVISDLKSEAMRERHWRSLFKQLKVQDHYSASSMTLGTVWDLDLKRHDVIIKAVVAQAQGELALEEYLKQVREAWTNYTLDLVNYQNKCRLIRGWDNLFQLAGDNLNALRAMSMSPHYKVFEEEASLWEDRLSKISVLFDTWIDVQRQWVYLEGIFSGSAEIRHILPVESSRFQNINTEFLTVMKKVYKSPFVLDVLNIPGVQKSLERLADLLSKIQKALGEYLERERANFPRFYFVGDEDLLEIIGNSKDTARILKHLKKMFAGIATVELDEGTGMLTAMVSREGESVPFRTPILLKDYPKINDWLAKVESEMRVSLAELLSEAAAELESFYVSTDSLTLENFLAWIAKYPAQLVVLAVQARWTAMVDEAFESGAGLQHPLDVVLRGLDLLADTVLTDVEALQRRKCEHLITELVHQRDVIRLLMSQRVESARDFNWLSQMRFYLNRQIEKPLDRLTVQMANATFPYGYEYLGVPDRLVQTPLTDRCYLTLTQALHYKLGGAPFGPAGTGKTESVKALGVQLGMFVIVFCCDETFDFQAMGRIFVGLCRVGAWGCFDEFNRLEERILSAVSQQIQSIQQGLADSSGNATSNEIELLGKRVPLNDRVGIFITTNPTYAGRSNLPDNLKKLFRNMAMTHPDRELIAQVMLFSQGFRTAERLASKIVPFFNLCLEQLSPQPHYDFGLRALKAVLVSAGSLKREHMLRGDDDAANAGSVVSVDVSEQEILIQSVSETIVPKLIAEDVPLLKSLLSDVFPGVEYKPVNLDVLRGHIAAVCAERHLVEGGLWTEKVLQLYQIQKISHGLMLVGPSGTGKTQAWQVLLAALERLEGQEGVSYVIDPKAVSKESLYGTLDPTTREWNDGLFTQVLRKIIDNVRGESAKRHWIVFDGDVDPEWVENLNSVLDDNKLLTLPNGERLNLPPNVRIMFEVESLRYATLATVSRCGMIWFSDDIVRPSMLYARYLTGLRSTPIELDDDELVGAITSRRVAAASSAAADGTGEVSADLLVQRAVADALAPFFEDDGLVNGALEFARTVPHIMDFTEARALSTLFSLLNKTIRNILDYNTQHPDFPLNPDQIETYATRRLLIALVWAFTGDAKLDVRAEMGEYLRSHTGVDLPSLGPGSSLIDYDVTFSGQTVEWSSWLSKVPTIEIDTAAVSSADVVVPTIDTVRHEDVLYSWLSEHKPLMLCGPPGSGKTMTLFSALRKLPDMEVVGLNFSSATTPELILKTFEQYCEYRKTPSGIVLSPTQIGRWLVLFCDEINLPATDKYGTQRVISFLRQLVECGGFWRISDKSWVRLERIQFVGACNPPTDPGRVALSHRFLRHAPLIMVDYPGEISLNQIYSTFNRALLKVTPNLRGYAEPLTAAMVDFYLASQRRFTPDIQAHYIYSPRELTRWMRGVYEAIKPLESLSVEGLVRVWAHEGLRLFADRLVDGEEKRWTDGMIDEVAARRFPTIDTGVALARPILFSNWLSKEYRSVDRESVREYAKARLRGYSDEELDASLVLHDSVLDLALSCDRVLRQPAGHLLLIGASGSGRTTVTRFCAWLRGLSLFSISTSNRYTEENFDDDLRSLLRRVGTKGEKVCWTIDESQMSNAARLEKLNTLLANAEVAGLFEGDEHASLISQLKEASQREGLMLDAEEELFGFFRAEITRNLHVTLTMNPPEGGTGGKAAASPALFNRTSIMFCW
ncbi:Dynein heavy chain, domain-1 [Kalmanozyma brasiliensis GHG001]|uniref:Dynein heavy chain, cytoplasmic n=1 Tax=Kalmanozyma brasiliensis (strain GHG001) TaxID=1365824 RepID=V5EJ13_KALBG|nr:Dynein heavy chain, domain-1 [Kalmanozyma brasiliensis GHG001]EST04700.1 Dynein heavy chain, domain-1 [Kalmanozyma brasiliensis GHG001]